MLCCEREIWLRVSLTCAIGVCSILGDLGIKYTEAEVLRAILDNITHATVGGLTWMLIVALSQKSFMRNLIAIFSCFLLASFIDMDHFIEARSLRLRNATHLEKRPFLHCTTIPIILWIFLILLSNVFHSPKLEEASWLILAAFLSHHIRDGTRRGLWLCPFGSIPPIPYYIYVSLNMLLPYLLYWLSSLLTFEKESNNHVVLTNI